MATKSKKSNTKWFQRSGAKPLLIAAVIAVFSVLGAVYLQSSNAESLSIVAKGHTEMQPGSSTSQKPYKVVEMVGGVGYKGETVYHLPNASAANSTWVKSTFESDSLVKGTSYRPCAGVRRDPRALQGQPASLSFGNGSSPSAYGKYSFSLKGSSTTYTELCGDWYTPSNTNDTPITLTLSNTNGYGVNVAFLRLKEVNRKAARCYQALVAPSGVGHCSFHPVSTGGYPLTGHCYILGLNDNSTGFVYTRASCDTGMFAQ